MKNNRKLCAFTLAEVLITLAIIGVVAAFTIPTVVRNYKRHVVLTKLKSAYSQINQALMMSRLENGNYENWDIPLNNYSYDEKIVWLNKYLKPYLKIMKYEKSKIDSHNVDIFLTNGSIFQFSYVDAPLKIMDFGFYTDKAAVDNIKPGANYFNFSFRQSPGYVYHYGKGVEPYAATWDGVKDHLKYMGDGYGCYESKYKMCAKLIQMNSWQFPDDYPYL